jgi:hypothetical protein
MRRVAVIAFAIAVVLLTIWASYRELHSQSARPLELASFIVLALTLIVLVWYAYDTNTIARVTQHKWLNEGGVNVTYALQLDPQKGSAGRTAVQLYNLSTLIVRARVNFNFRIYGQAVSAGGLYDGKDVWLLFPQQSTQGWFEVEELAQKRGKTVVTMMSESTPANRKEQLTMVLELEFWDDLGARRKLPGRPHYFDFDRWAWIPQIADPSS